MLPDITHLQFVILSSLLTGDKSGHELRATLKENGVNRSLPAFYQLMSRMDQASLVEGWYETKVIEGKGLKESWYRITADGHMAHQRTQAFYDQQKEAATPRNLGLQGA